MTSIDSKVGALLRLRRETLGRAIDEVALAMGITGEELHALESGKVRMLPDLMMLASKVLGVPIEYFFQAVEGGPTPPPRTRACSGRTYNYRSGKPEADITLVA